MFGWYSYQGQTPPPRTPVISAWKRPFTRTPSFILTNLPFRQQVIKIYQLYFSINNHTKNNGNHSKWSSVKFKQVTSIRKIAPFSKVKSYSTCISTSTLYPKLSIAPGLQPRSTLLIFKQCKLGNRRVHAFVPVSVQRTPVAPVALFYV